MTTLVADTSGLVSLGSVADADPDPLALCLDEYDVYLPEEVVDELDEMASYDDHHARAANAVRDRRDETTVQSVALDAEFPLDDGENAAVTLANDLDAALCLCDEFNRLGLVHASLADCRRQTHALSSTTSVPLVAGRRTATSDGRARCSTERRDPHRFAGWSRTPRP